ncbi:MAG: hypothetical protein LC667_09905, partial [Thioalkalivibrio sp.]|nr:hypothetical protein [Thioalkalivibrio sp.]
GRDAGEHGLGAGDGELVPVVFAQRHHVDADPFCQHRLVDGGADRLRVRDGLAPVVAGQVAEAVDAELEVVRGGVPLRGRPKVVLGPRGRERSRRAGWAAA